MTSAEDRRARWDNTCAAAAARGTPVESDPRFIEWIEEWINGQIEMATVRQRYLGLLSPRTGVAAAAPAKTLLDEIFDEVPEITGLRPRDEQVRRDTSEAIDAAWDRRLP